MILLDLHVGWYYDITIIKVKCFTLEVTILYDLAVVLCVVGIVKLTGYISCIINRSPLFLNQDLSVFSVRVGETQILSYYLQVYSFSFA